MIFIISLIIGLLVASIFLLSGEDESSLLKERFKKTSKSRNIKKNITSDLDGFAKNLVEKMKLNKKQINKTKQLLLQAGYASSDEDVMKFEVKKVKSMLYGLGIGLVIALLVFSPQNVGMCLIILICLPFYMYERYVFVLQKKIKLRQKEFTKYLPDAVDLLAICVEAGLGLDASFSKVSDEFMLTSKTISTEFDRLNKDILAGINREDAYKNLITRNQVPDLQSFVALLIQSEKLGTSITQSLDAFCDTLRTKKRQRIEELSQQASTKMTIPMVLFMLPAIFIIILFPAMQKIMVNLGHM
jgi:tight adherence protein C